MRYWNALIVQLKSDSFQIELKEMNKSNRLLVSVVLFVAMASLAVAPLPVVEASLPIPEISLVKLRITWGNPFLYGFAF